MTSAEGPPPLSSTLRLLAAGSLAEAFAGLASGGGGAVDPVLGPSGLLAERIVAGARWDVFASADTGHPGRLHRAGLATPPRVFCRNALALVLRPGLGGRDAMALLRDGRLRLGISTPGNDPSGDYAVAALDRLDPGLARRALRVTGAPGLPRPPDARNVYAWVVSSGQVDMMLTYRSNAIAACRDTPDLGSLDLPAAVQPDIAYALTTRIGAGPEAAGLARIILSGAVQARLAGLGFVTRTGAGPRRDGGVR